MSKRPKIDPTAVVTAVRAHGFRRVIRAGIHLSSVALYLQAEGADARPTQAALAEYWGSSRPTVEREARAWREVTGREADEVWAMAAAVVAAGVLDGSPDEASALAVLPFLTA